MSARTTLIVAAAVLLGCGSGGRTAALREENRKLRAQNDAFDHALSGATAYRDVLSGRGGGDTTWLILTGADVERLAQGVLPYKIPANRFHAQVTGEVHVESIQDVRFEPGNYLVCTAHLRGVGLRFKGQIPASYRNQVNRFLDGVHAGVVATLVVQLSPRGQVLSARAEARRVALKKNRDRNHEAQLLREMNNRVLRQALEFDVAIEGTPLRLRHVALTRDHLAVGYAP